MPYKCTEFQLACSTSLQVKVIFRVYEKRKTQKSLFTHISETVYAIFFKVSM